jgi:hypothetical protein
MQNPKQRSLQSYRRMRDWKQSHDGIMQAAPAPIHLHFNQLDVVIGRIETNAALQVSQHQRSTRDATDADAAKDAVRGAMRPIAQVARSLKGTVYGISSIATMPDPNHDNEKLVTAANSMAENATIFAQALIDHGLQPDCIDTLRSAAAVLKSSIDARGAARAMAIGARDGLRADFAEANKLVSLIDAGLMALLKADPANLASWQNAKRITLKGVVGTIVPPAPQGTAPSATPAAATAATAATAVQGTTRAA